MLVETYECHETAAEPIEACEEAVRLMMELGCDGQQELLKTDANDIVRRLPYREMTADEDFVYSVLCPVKVQLSRYRSSPIPLRVLQVAAHAKATEQFDELLVWDRGTAAEKDPVLVGMKPDPANPTYTWLRKKFILARWGEELEAFAVLLKRAVDTKRQQFLDGIRSVAARTSAEESRIIGMSTADIITAGADAKIELTTIH